MTKQMMTPTTVSGNDFFAGMVSAAKQGDTKAGLTCLYVFGHALRDKKLLDPALAHYVGNCLIDAAQRVVTLREEKTEKRATEIAKAMGLIAARPGPRKPYFTPFRRSLDAASLVIHFHNEGCPLTRNEDGAIYRAAEILGHSPSTVEADYRKVKKQYIYQDPEFRELTHTHAERLIKKSRKRTQGENSR